MNFVTVIQFLSIPMVISLKGIIPYGNRVSNCMLLCLTEFSLAKYSDLAVYTK